MIGIAVVVVTLCAACTSGISLTHFEFERGSRGIVPCPTMVDRGYSASDTEAIYWFFLPKGSSEPRKRILSNYRGLTHNTDPDKYNYTIQNASLVISNVTQSAEGTYSYKYTPKLNSELQGSVEVSEKVSCKARRPKVNGCGRDQPSCARISHTIYTELTCSVEHVKPAVDINWFRWSSNMNTWERIPAEPQFKNVSCNESESECFYVIDTRNYFTTIEVSLDSNNSIFECRTNISKLENFTVTVIKSGSDVVNEVTNSTRFAPEDTLTPTNTFHERRFWGFCMLLFLCGVCVGVTFHLLIFLCKRQRKRIVKV